MASAVVELRSIYKQFAGKPLFENLNLAINDKEFVTLLGPSGCGKTTILRMIAGFESPDQGALLLHGQDITNLPCNKRQVNTVFQNYALFPHMSVYDNIAFGLRMAKQNETEIKKRVGEALDMVKLKDFAFRRPSELSGGQQQRVALARAVVMRPAILLLDEPLSALDKNLRLDMQIELKALQRNLGITFLFVTHDQEEALSMSDRIIVLNHGKIEQIGTPIEVYEIPKNLFVAQFIGQSNFFDAVIKEVDHSDVLTVQMEDGEYKLNRKNTFHQGDRVRILLRAEDIKVYKADELHKINRDVPIFSGKIVDRTYKGMTLDSIIKLDNGQDIMAREFFDEDDPSFDYRLGEKVYISWNKNWEVILPYED